MLSALTMSPPVGAVSDGYSGVMIWGGVAMVAVLLLGFGMLWFRRKFHPDSVLREDTPASFSIENIEKMRADGIISDDEFRCLRAGALGLDAPKVDNDNSTLSSPTDVDDATEELDLSNEPKDYKESK